MTDLIRLAEKMDRCGRHAHADKAMRTVCLAAAEWIEREIQKDVGQRMQQNTTRMRMRFLELLGYPPIIGQWGIWMILSGKYALGQAIHNHFARMPRPPQREQIDNALGMMGEEEMRRWICLNVLRAPPRLTDAARTVTRMPDQEVYNAILTKEGRHPSQQQADNQPIAVPHGVDLSNMIGMDTSQYRQV